MRRSVFFPCGGSPTVYHSQAALTSGDDNPQKFENFSEKIQKRCFTSPQDGVSYKQAEAYRTQKQK